MPDGKPNILAVWGDDIGVDSLSCYSDVQSTPTELVVVPGREFTMGDDHAEPEERPAPCRIRDLGRRRGAPPRHQRGSTPSSPTPTG